MSKDPKISKPAKAIKKPSKKTKATKKSRKSPKLGVKEWALRGSLAIIFIVLTMSSLFRGFNLVQFYKVLTGKEEVAQTFRDYACRTPESVGGEIEATPMSKSFENARLKDSDLTTNMIINGNLTDIDTAQPDRPKGFQSSYYGTIEATYSYNRTPDNGSPVVRVDVASAGEQAGAGWVATPAEITKGETGFLYETDYRSDVTTYITVEITDDKGGITYESIGRLTPSAAWKNHRARFTVNRDTTKVRAYQVLTTKGYLETRNIKLFNLENKLQAPIISVNFDDGWRSVYEKGLPVMEQYGIVSTQYIVASYLTSPEAYMTRAEVEDMQKRGHEIGSHSLKHCDLAKLSDEELEYDTNASKEILEERFGTMHGMAYPFGSYSARTNNLMDDYYAYTRTTEAGYNDSYYDQYGIKVKNIFLDTTAEDVQEWIDYAKAHNSWLVLVYHAVEDAGQYDVTPENFDKHMKAVKDSGVEVLTMKDAIKKIDTLR